MSTSLSKNKNGYINSSCIKVLIAEKEGMYRESYVARFKKISEAGTNLIFDLSLSSKFEDARNTLKVSTFNLVILALSFRSNETNVVHKGEELGEWLRLHKRETKIIICTYVEHKFRLFKILKKINPEGFFFKTDMNNDSFERMIMDVIKGRPAYSPTIIELLKIESRLNREIDENDRLIIDCLAKGMSTTCIVEQVPLSRSSIENRKRKLARIFDLPATNSADIVRVAREKGLC